MKYPIISHTPEKARDLFITNLYSFQSAGYKLLRSWEQLDEKSMKKTDGGKYPFDHSFDEVVANIGLWINNIEAMFESIDDYEPTITVGELKKILNKLEDDIHVVVGNYNDYYGNINTVDVPNDEERIALTLNIADTFDPRQF